MSKYEIYDSQKGQKAIEFLEKMIAAQNESYAKTDKLFHVEELNNEPPQKAKKPSMLGKLDDNRQKVERVIAERSDKPVTKKPGDLEVD